MSRIVISTARQFVDLAKNKPELLSIPAFQPLSRVIKEQSTKKTGGCNCGSGSRVTPVISSMFESGMAILTTADKTKLLQILGVSKFCYYTRSADGVLNQVCIGQ